MDQNYQPQQPSQPATPVQPAQPQQPAAPVQPVQQYQSAAPVQPQQPAQPYQPQQPVGGYQNYQQGYYQQSNVSTMPGAAYPMTERDRTLRMVAFIFVIVSCVINAFLVVPLLWLVPMAWWSWCIYKGKKPNTVLFGVLCLIFCSLVSGILLLVSTKDK